MSLSREWHLLTNIVAHHWENKATHLETPPCIIQTIQIYFHEVAESYIWDMHTCTCTCMYTHTLPEVCAVFKVWCDPTHLGREQKFLRIKCWRPDSFLKCILKELVLWKILYFYVLYDNIPGNYHIISWGSLWNTDLSDNNPGILSNNIIVYNSNNIR